MSPVVETLNYYLALGTVLLQIVCIGLVLLVVLRKTDMIGAFVARFGLLIAFLFAIASTALTLLYSEVFGFEPCGLCWLQRVFLYPQVVLFGVALWKRDAHVALYSIWLSVLGAVIALYQHYIQMGGTEFIDCPVALGDCAKRILFEFGYVTFPLMSFTGFIFLILLMVVYRKHVNTRI